MKMLEYMFRTMTFGVIFAYLDEMSEVPGWIFWIGLGFACMWQFSSEIEVKK